MKCLLLRGILGGTIYIVKTTLMDTQNYKAKLEGELAQVEAELKTAGKLINEESGNWEGAAPEMDTMPPQAEPNEAGDKIEEFEANRGITENLEARWKEVKHALEKIERGSYGKCEAGADHEIEEERLEANPAARTCMQHM